MARTSPKSKDVTRQSRIKETAKMSEPAGAHGTTPNPSMQLHGKGEDSGTGSKSVNMPGGSTGNRKGKK